NVYDEAGLLHASKWRNPDGNEGSTEAKYDQYGQPIRYGAEVTYSSEAGRKVKTEIFEPKTPGLDRSFGFGEGPSQASWMIQNAALATTFFDGMVRPAEIVFYDDEHVQISRLVRTYDERNRVTSEENQVLSPRLFAGQRNSQGEEISKE